MQRRTYQGLQRSIELMAGRGVRQAAISTFADYYELLVSGATGVISEDSIRPLLNPTRIDSAAISEAEARAALAQTVVIKLNGGLGTSMGVSRAKSLLPVRDRRSFLDLIIAQVEAARSRLDVQLPLIFMNSFRTRTDTAAVLAQHPGLAVDGIPLDFLQSQEPKLLATDLNPVKWPADPDLEWCPPGHGDIYPSLSGSGLLDRLLDTGFRYASVSNADNLGAVPDPLIAGWFAGSGAPYAAEVCIRTEMDAKGGHLAVRKNDGQLILRDIAQTDSSELAFFTDIDRHPYFHTNNLWWDLEALRDALVARKGVLGLPLIRNVKTVDPTDPVSPKVIQIESAMGAAIEVFTGAAAIAVDRSRFLPVKTTNDLLLVRSDVYEVSDDGSLTQTAPAPVVHLSGHYRTVASLDARFPGGPPSLRNATSLRVEGDWHFGADVTVVGDALLGPEGGSIPSGATIGG